MARSWSKESIENFDMDLKPLTALVCGFLQVHRDLARTQAKGSLG